MPNVENCTSSDDEYQDAKSGVESIKQDSVNLSGTNKSYDDDKHITEKCNSIHISDEDNCNHDECDKQSVNASAVNDMDEGENSLLERDKTLTDDEIERNQQNSECMKLKANELFKNNKPLEAIELYTEALKICPIKYSKDRAILYGNRGAAKIKLDSKKSAIEDCTKAIELWPDYVRVRLRRAKLYELDDKLDEALIDYKHVIELDAGNHEAREALMRLPPMIEERNERLKAEMLDKLKDLGNMILKPFGLSTSNFQMQKDPTTGSYSINFNQK